MLLITWRKYISDIKLKLTASATSRDAEVEMLLE